MIHSAWILKGVAGVQQISKVREDMLSERMPRVEPLFYDVNSHNGGAFNHNISINCQFLRI
ncbi:hypothetical protein J6590_013547 [Homalodisca vitripennis]|nr:hypothetical protein J6590_013547 [Homalodisca vitripennis]